jgi:mannose-6-phosphate isomerase-like protein (cupin superfamily)
MTFGTTAGKPWVEAIPTDRGTSFTCRTFSRLHMVGNTKGVPFVGEIWTTSDHAVESHSHESDELLYVLSGAIEVNGQRLESDEMVFIPRGTEYRARVASGEGSHILRVEMPHASSEPRVSGYDVRNWDGPLTEEGVPRLRDLQFNAKNE